METDAAADELYGLLPGEFVSRRNELAKQMRTSADREGAEVIRGLRRPTQSAWALNQWVRRDPDGVEALTTLGADLLAAQRRGATDRVRALSADRQKLVSEATVAVAAVAAERGIPISDAAAREVAASLRAAIADEEVAAQLRGGRLVAPAEYSGFGPAGLVLVPDPIPDSTPAGDTRFATDAGVTAHESQDEDRVRGAALAELAAAALAELAAAADEEARTRAEVDRFATNFGDARAAAARVAARADVVRAELTRLEGELRFARRRESGAEKAHDDARTRHRAAHRRLVAAQKNFGA